MDASLPFLKGKNCRRDYLNSKLALIGGASVGCIIFPPLTKFLLESGGWKFAVGVFAGLLLLTCGFAMLLKPLEVVLDNQSVCAMTPEVQSMSKVVIGNEVDVWKPEEEEEEEKKHRKQLRRTNSQPSFQLPTKPKQDRARSVCLSKNDGMMNSISSVNFDTGSQLSLNSRSLQFHVSRRGTRFSIASSSEICAFDATLQPQPRGSGSSSYRSLVMPFQRNDTYFSGTSMKLSQRKMSSFIQRPENEMKERMKFRHNSDCALTEESDDLSSRIVDLLRRSSIDFTFDLDVDDLKTENKSSALALLKRFLDLKTLTKLPFVIFLLSNILTFLAYYVPFMFLPAILKEHDVPDNLLAYIIPVIGLSNMISRIAMGALVDLPWINSLVINNITQFVCGICMVAFPFCHGFVEFCIVGLIFGLAAAPIFSVVAIVLVDLFGIESLTSTFGVLLLFRGVASILGPPFAGLLHDIMGNYNLGFIVAGGMFFLASIVGEVVHILEFYYHKIQKK